MPMSLRVESLVLYRVLVGLGKRFVVVVAKYEDNTSRNIEDIINDKA